jgi:hypothetical protein
MARAVKLFTPVTCVFKQGHILPIGLHLRIHQVVDAQQLEAHERDRLVIPECKQNMTTLRGQASWAKLMSLKGKLTAPACHPTKYVNKAE